MKVQKTPDELKQQEYLRGPEVCRLLGDIHPATLWKWRKHRDFPDPARSTPGSNFYRTRDVLAWMERQA